MEFVLCLSGLFWNMIPSMGLAREVLVPKQYIHILIIWHISVCSIFFYPLFYSSLAHDSSIRSLVQVRVVSPDKDFFQILSPSLRLLRIAPRGFELVSLLAVDKLSEICPFICFSYLLCMTVSCLKVLGCLTCFNVLRSYSQLAATRKVPFLQWNFHPFYFLP